MKTPDELLKRMALGAAAGLAGTFALQLVRAAQTRYVPRSEEPMHEDPGQYMVRHAERALPIKVRERIPEAARETVANSLGFGYGMTFGAAYAAVRPDGGAIVPEGLVLGLACWAVGYLGWLPGAGITPPLWDQSPLEIAGPIANHAVYGLATVATYELLEKNV